MNILKDSFGRKFPYIRLSISDVCNFKCGYCLPDGYKIDKSDNRSFLNIEEIGRLAKALSELGVSKIRLTGGEPTVRKDFFEIIKIIKENSGIKLMQTGDNINYFNNYHVPAKKFTDYLNNNNWIIQTFGKDAGPSKNYLNPKFKGKFGVIAPYSKDFCKSCNRLRITAKGDLRLCLFGNTGINIRHLMQKDNQIEELKDLILKQLNFKKESHYLEIGETGLTKNLSTTGG
jgi:cyclic pyranopterin phosphate synthase